MNPESLFQDNLGIAQKIARSWVRTGAVYGYDYEDLQQEAYIKLWQAVQSYDPEKAKISTWAYRLINNGFKSRFQTKIPKLEGVPEVESSDGNTREYEFKDYKPVRFYEKTLASQIYNKSINYLTYRS